MKKILTLIILCLPMMAFAQHRILVITDPHVFVDSLFERGAAFDDMMAQQRKMIDLSAATWSALMDTARKYRPDLVLIPGDLTKDGEKASHDLVAQSLQALQQEGIPTLLIPGNHDISGNAYAYHGNDKMPVPNLPDSSWESQYAFMYNNVQAKDPHSHSYAAEPIPGLTVLGIDGAHNTASIGSLSSQTLTWLLHQADSAVAKGNTIIAISHWQVLEHFDKQGTLESSCRFANADALRDSLMHHGVRVLLTGHFHVNGITTFRDTTGLTQDSIVEITTGSPITYPCPYRWMTVSADRAYIDVTTDYLTALDTIPNLNTYSREWMRVHTNDLIPTLALRGWNKVEANWSRVDAALSAVHMSYLSSYLHAALPQTDSAKVELVYRHLGPQIVNLYLFHSEANEFEHPQRAQALADSIYNGINGMMYEVFTLFSELVGLFANMGQGMVEEPVQSLVEDVTMWASSQYADCTNDLQLRLYCNEPQAVETVGYESPAIKRIENGTVVIERDNRLFTIFGQQIYE